VRPILSLNNRVGGAAGGGATIRTDFPTRGEGELPGRPCCTPRQRSRSGNQLPSKTKFCPSCRRRLSYRADRGLTGCGQEADLCLARVQPSQRYPSELHIRGFDEPGADFVEVMPLDFMDDVTISRQTQLVVAPVAMTAIPSVDTEPVSEHSGIH
jgi:hypothetical protein